MKCANCGFQNPAGMNFCGGCGAGLRGTPPTDRPVDSHTAAHRRHMTVMFCDIVESTPLAQTLDPEDFREVLSDYQHACARAIERFHGHIARYSGDGLVVYFGYPRAREDSAHGAVHAGLGILEELVALNVDLARRHGISLDVRIGIHSGLVVAGEMGVGATRDQMAIVGDTPHIAARLESIAAPGTVVISDATRDLTEGYFETESLGEQALKGVSGPVVVHRVLRPTGAIGRLEVAGARRLTPLVGRDAELARLAEVWQRVKGGRGAVVQIMGEAGIGKSRIVRELLDRLGQQVGAEQIWQCSGHHQSTPLYPVIRFLERFIGLDRSAPAPHQLELIRQAAVAADLDPIEAVSSVADLLAIGGRDGDAARSTQTPRDARTAMLNILEALLVADPARHPLLLVVEDVHWADPTTVELLDRIILKLPQIPVLCVLTFRPDFVPSWAASSAIGVELGPLTSDGVRALAAWASPKPLDPAVLDWVESAADGIPLFVEETLKMFEHAETGAVPSDTGYTVVPSTLQGLLTERLERLPDLGDLIDVAAVLGREFDRGLLEAIWQSEAPALEPALLQLAAHDVLRPVAGAPSRCEFTHALLQEAAYERILRRHRQLLHGRVATSLISSSAATAEREPEVVAHHWSCAAQPAKAVRYWHAAGIRALERAAFLEASHHFRRGLEALDAIGPDPGPHPPDDLERADFLTHLAASLQAGHGYAAAGVKEAYAKARSSYERAGNQERLVSVIRGQWLFHLLRSEYGTARELADEMLSLGRRGGDPVLLAEGHLYCGFVHMYVADFDQAREQLEDAFTHYRRPDRSDHIYEAQGDTGVMALAYLALVLWNLGYADRCRDRSDLSLELAERVGGPVTRAQAWGMRSILHLSRGESVELSYWVDRALAVSVDSNIGYWRAVSTTLSAWQRGRSRDLESGIAALQESLDDYLRSGSSLSLPHFCIYLADLRLAAGDRAGSLDALRIGEEHIEATGEGFAESELYRFKGRALMAGGAPDPAAATAAYERAVATARAQNAKLLELRACSRLAVHQARIGAPRSALPDVAALCDWFTSASELPDVARARMLLAQGSRAG